MSSNSSSSAESVLYPPDFKPAKSLKLKPPKHIHHKKISPEFIESNDDESSPDEDFNGRAPKAAKINLLKKKKVLLTSTPAKGSPQTPKSPDQEDTTDKATDDAITTVSSSKDDSPPNTEEKVVSSSTNPASDDLLKDSNSNKSPEDGQIAQESSQPDANANVKPPGIEEVTPHTSPTQQTTASADTNTVVKSPEKGVFLY